MSDYTSIDPSTPVLVGVGQYAERIDAEGYQGLSVVGLAAAAAEKALADTGIDSPGGGSTALAARIDTVVGVRQFADSSPVSFHPLGSSDNYPRSVADRVAVEPAEAILEVVGGQSPQHLVTEMAGRIAAGAASAVLIFGAEAISTERHLAKTLADNLPSWHEQRGGQLTDRGFALSGIIHRASVMHNLFDPPSQYALLEHARRARLGVSVEDHARSMGELFAPFTAVAAKNPYAAVPEERTAAELSTLSDRNRMIADPYPRFLVARDQVNQGAAVVLTSVGLARELGIDKSRWVFLHGHADLREQRFLDRPDLGQAPAAVRAAEHALEVAGIGVDDLDAIDLYSCFPIAVAVVAEALGLSADDPRGLTVTGGLPYFGGAGNNYSMHAIAEVVDRVRATPGSYGFIGANGGNLSKYSAGVYSTAPTAWRHDQSSQIQAELDAVAPVPLTTYADGSATLETYTIAHAGEQRTGIVIGRTVGGKRFLANTVDGDDKFLDALAAGDLIGKRIFVQSDGRGNTVTFDSVRMAELNPRSMTTGFRDDYEFVLVERRGRILEVTINRPEVRNALHPRANAELDEIFDAYFADPDLWVAILTGAGDKAFSSGNDLQYMASGRRMSVPKNGFAGLTGRAGMNKPVIAAVNGFAMGGGLEIALACHLVVADPAANFALSEVHVGLIAAAGGLVRLPRTIPEKFANEMILTGKKVLAEQAREFGIVNRISEPGQVLDAARELAEEIVAASPTSVRISLEIMEESKKIGDITAAVQEPYAAFDDLILSADMFEGLAAFGAKRAPNWRNR